MSALSSIELSFSTGRGKKAGAWDDSEIVSAYDAALQEFHVHHPGPGSWLDKATAALAKGKPLPGANAFGTAWYSSYTEGSTDRSKRKRDEPTTNGTSSAEKPGQANPYDPVGGYRVGRSKDTRASPSYQPPSPGAAANAEDEAEEDAEEDQGEVFEGYDGEGYDDYDQVEERRGWGAEGQADGIFPQPGASWPVPADVGYDEALGYALNAQYWAGYWMGLAKGVGSTGGRGSARSRGRGQGRARPGVRRTVDVDPVGMDEDAMEETHANGLMPQAFTAGLRR